MKDHPQTPAPRSDNPGDPETAREPSAAVRYGETDWYIFHFVLFTTTGVIAMIVYQVINPVGSPLDTIRSITLNVGQHIRDGYCIRRGPGPCIEDRQVRLPPPAATAIQVQGTTTPKVKLLRRGNGDGAAPWPVRAKGPAPLPGHRSCRKPSGATARRSPRSPSALLPVPAIRAMPAPLYRRTLTGPTPAPIPLINCRRLSTRPTPWHDPSRSPPCGSPRRRRREPSVGRRWAAARGPDRSPSTSRQEVIKYAPTGSSHTAAPVPPAPTRPERPPRPPASPKYERF